MRKLQRFVARANMKTMDIRQLNKKLSSSRGRKKTSTFSNVWRDYIFTEEKRKKYQREKEE